MYTSGYDMPDLFKQLGLEHDQASIDALERAAAVMASHSLGVNR